MTTCVFDVKTKTIAVDSRNTDSSGRVFLCDKIERLPGGRFFLGAGHLLTIAKVRGWALTNFAEEMRPDFEELFGERADDFSMSCLVISPDGTEVTLIDDEMTPQPVLDDYVTIGSGGSVALGALAAGATPEQAVEIAIRYDGNSGGPVKTYTIG